MPREKAIEERRKSARKEKFRIRKTAGEKVFADYRVDSPSGRTYRVAIRGFSLGDNYCACPDFRANTLGTCKHIETVLAKLRRRTSAAVRRTRPNVKGSELFLRYGKELEICCRVRTGRGRRERKLLAEYFDLSRPTNGVCEGRLRPGKLEEVPGLINRLRAHKTPVTVYPDLLEHVETTLRLQADLALEKVLALRVEDPDFLGDLVNTRLYPYQKRGVLFLALRGRTLLADDMGLGKTVQAIAAAEYLARSNGLNRVLVICPASLKHQWEREIERFTTRRCKVIGGTARQRHLQYDEQAFFQIINYEAARSDARFLRTKHYDLIILDEAQRIKNWKTRLSREIKSLRSPYCMVLTGTPLENRLEELFNIVQYVDDRRLGPSFQFLHDHVLTDPQLKGKAIGYQGLESLRAELAPICLRRTKGEVLKDLPPRIDKNFYVELSPAQRGPYGDEAKTVGGLLKKWRRQGFLSDRDQRRLLIALSNMRMICNSLYLYDKKTRAEPKLDEFGRLIEDLAIGLGEKVVVFSQWEGTLRLIEPRLKKLGLGYALLCGAVPVKKRGSLIRGFFDDDRQRVFLSTDAGGVGLNLQAASCVVNVEIPWNPAVLNQRVSRVHRLGQHRTVRNFNLLTRGTIEEHIWNLLAFKTELFEGIFKGSSDKVVMRPKGESKLLTAVEKMMQSDRSLVRNDRPVHVPSRDVLPDGDTPSGERTPPHPWAEIGSLMMKMITSLVGDPMTPARKDGNAPGSRPRFTTDPDTGEQLLSLPVKDKERLSEGLAALGDLFGSLARKLR